MASRCTRTGSGAACSSSDDGRTLHVVVELRHAVRPITVRVHTVLDGTPILTRWLEIINTGAGAGRPLRRLSLERRAAIQHQARHL